MSDAAPSTEPFALSPAPVSGGRRRRMSRKLRATKKKIAQLKKYAKKLGGAAEDVEKAADVAEDKVEDVQEDVMGARRRRKTKKARKSRRSLFGLKY